MDQTEINKDTQNVELEPIEQNDSGTNQTNHDKIPEEAQPETAPITDNAVSATSKPEDNRAAEDDGGEVVEDNEDTVIY
jgi:hypothetical protein